MFKPPPSTIPADSVIAAIERGDSIRISLCEISGPLRKEGTKERPDTINSYINIWLTTLYDSVSFRFCHFTRDIIFQGVFSKENIDFLGAIFSKRALFTGVNSKKTANFSSSTFSESTSFSRTRFRRDADFSDAYFGDFTSFNSVTFDRKAVFFYATFSKNADFSNTTFRDEADFWSATFSADAHFDTAHFNERAYFREATFDGNTYFHLTTFEEDVYFQGAAFGGLINLSPLRFNEMYISWKQLESRFISDIPTSFRLMKYFEKERMLDDADGIYLFLKDLERKAKPCYLRYPEYWLIQQTCGYGVKPQNTLYICVGIIILFASLYFFADAIRPRMGVKKGSFFDALYFSFQTFIIGTVADWYPKDQYLIRVGSIRFLKFRTLSMMEGALGWILVILFIISLGRKFIR